MDGVLAADRGTLTSQELSQRSLQVHNSSAAERIDWWRIQTILKDMQHISERDFSLSKDVIVECLRFALRTKLHGQEMTKHLELESLASQISICIWTG